MRERTILDQLADHARERVAETKKKIPFEEMKQMALEMVAKEPVRDAFAFEKALHRSELSFICECKKASPSKGLIAPDFPYLEIAKEYEKAGADCISVLTEPRWFLGKDQYLKEIAANVSIPCLRKDFTVDPYFTMESIRSIRTLPPSASSVWMVLPAMPRPPENFGNGRLPVPPK